MQCNASHEVCPCFVEAVKQQKRQDQAPLLGHLVTRSVHLLQKQSRRRAHRVGIEPSRHLYLPFFSLALVRVSLSAGTRRHSTRNFVRSVFHSCCPPLQPPPLSLLNGQGQLTLHHPKLQGIRHILMIILILFAVIVIVIVIPIPTRSHNSSQNHQSSSRSRGFHFLFLGRHASNYGKSFERVAAESLNANGVDVLLWPCPPPPPTRPLSRLVFHCSN